MECRTIGFVEPITGVEWQKLEFGALRQIGRLVDNQPSRSDTCLDGHGNESNTGRAAQQALAAVGAWCDREAPRLKRNVSAVAANCHAIVTHNVRDFAGAGRFAVQIVKPGDFLAAFEAEA